ncbi:hypothetical protein LJC32_02255, partial [Oscillospiraceae bacterium OttesenSCG-928-F05]|nr:hypothetical protein [Oscillospiraceae bacterium OttesenSCG-928-F05]
HTRDHTHITGVYGTKLHFNGKLYGVPGNATCVFEYDPRTNTAEVVGRFDDGRYNQAKFAGGAVLPDGDIFLVPAFGRFAGKFVFDGAPKLSKTMKGLLKSPYFNGY